MNVKRIVAIAIAFGLSAMAAHRGAAIPLHYDISGGSVLASWSDPGLVIKTSLSSGLSSQQFTLDDGQSSGWFNFFNIWTDETTVNADDLLSKAITATLMFSDPMANATVSGVTYGASLWSGLIQTGGVSWNAPSIVTLGDRSFSVTLSQEYFNASVLGLSGGKKHGATVKAKIAQLNSSTATSVPDSANTLVLLGAALGALAYLSRTRRGTAPAT